MSALGHASQRGAKAARIGSKWAARREISSPRRPVTCSGWPCAVDQTACTMLPRSKRPVWNARWRRTERAEKAAAYAAIALQSRRLGLWRRRIIAAAIVGPGLADRKSTRL